MNLIRRIGNFYYRERLKIEVRRVWNEQRRDEKLIKEMPGYDACKEENGVNK